MFPIALVLLAQVSPPRAFPFEIHSNKPFVQVTIDGSAPQWFILDSGNNGPTLIARECADRLKIGRSDDAKADIGAGSGADVRLSTASQVVRFEALGETMTVAQPRVLTLDHVARVEGHQVDEACDGPSALVAFRRSPPDIAIIDIGLPGMDGYELARLLRDEPLGRDATLVALTGYGFPEDYQRSREAGFDRHLVKPVSPEDLRRELGALRP